MKVVLEEGDSLYIPSFWWHHVKSSVGKNIAINFWYTPNFMYDNFMDGIEKEII